MSSRYRRSDRWNLVFEGGFMDDRLLGLLGLDGYPAKVALVYACGLPGAASYSRVLRRRLEPLTRFVTAGRQP